MPLQATSNPAGNPRITDTTLADVPGEEESGDEFERFEGLTDKLLRVPKSELDAKLREGDADAT